MKRGYFNIFDCIITIIVTAYLIIKFDLSIYNDALWLLVIYFIALGITNLIARYDYIHNKQAKKLVSVKKRHKNNNDCYNNKVNEIMATRKGNSKYSKRPKYYETLFSTDYELCFTVMKLIIGLLVSIILAVIISCGKNLGKEFQNFSEAFLIDAYLLPLVLMFISAFFNHVSPKEGCINLFQIMCTNKKGKKNIFRGIILSILLFIITSIALVFTMAEFITFEYGRLAGIITIVIATAFLTYSIKGPISK